MSVSHLAGPPITVQGRVLQRCLICGDKLCDSKNVAMVQTPGEPPPTYATWEKGRFVRFSGENPQQMVLLEDSETLPHDSCIDLVED